MKLITLTKLFSRERPFFYLRLWNDTDRMGHRDFAKHAIKNSLFIFGENNKSTVWYDEKELETANKKFISILRKRPEVFEQMKALLDKEWKYLLPILRNKRKLQSVDDFADYYKHLVKWWSAMTLWFNLSLASSAPKKFVARALDYRKKTQHYSDNMHKVFVSFWATKFPQYKDITAVICQKRL